MLAKLGLNDVRVRMLSISVGVLILVVGVTAFFCQNSRRVDSASNRVSPPTLNLNAGNSNRTIRITDVAVSPALEPPAEEAKQEPTREVKKNKKYRSAANKLAMASRNHFAAPPLDPAHPSALVEMWKGTSKTVVAVPPGSKFEE